MNRVAWPSVGSHADIDARTWRHDLVAIAVIAVLSLAIVLALPKGRPHLREITVDNPTPYTLVLRVVAPDGSTTALGLVEPADQTTLRDVVDSGDVWTVRASAQGEAASDFEIDGREAGASGWVLAVPTRVAADLAARGVSPVPYLEARE